MITGPFSFSQPPWGGSWGALDPWDCVCGVEATHAMDGQHHRATELCAGEGARDGEGGRPGRWALTQAYVCPNPQPFPVPGDLGFCLAPSGSPSHSDACLQTHNSAMTWNYVMRQWPSWMRSSCVPSDLCWATAFIICCAKNINICTSRYEIQHLGDDLDNSTTWVTHLYTYTNYKLMHQSYPSFPSSPTAYLSSFSLAFCSLLSKISEVIGQLTHASNW